MPKKVAFLDRDGVINKKAAEHHYITRVEDFIFNEGIFELLHSLQKEGFEFIIITNQRGVSRGIFSLETLDEIHAYMKAFLKTRGIEVLELFYCPHDEGECDCRKPKPGMLQEACKKYDIELDESVFITDSKKEVEMAKAFGIKRSFLAPVDRPEVVLDVLFI